MESDTLYTLNLEYESNRTKIFTSNKERFTDRYGDVFVYCTLKDICETFSCGHDKATKMLKELERYGLISRLQQGKGRPARIYFTAIGLFDIPTEQELLRTVEKLQNKKQTISKSA